MDRNEEIRQRYTYGETIVELGKAFNLSRQRIAIIVADLPKHYGSIESKQKHETASERRQQKQAEKDKIVAMYVGGMTQEQIALRVGKSQSMISKILMAANAVRPKAHRAHAKMPQILELRAQGKTQQQIAEAVGLHQTHISALLRKNRGEALRKA